MAWRDFLLECSFRSETFDVVGTRDSYGRATSVAEAPYVDGGVVEDLGGRPLRISLRAVFFGADYEGRLAGLIAALQEPGSGGLVHPVLGNIDAQAVSWEVGHEAPEPDSCTLSIEFIETGEPADFFVNAGAVGVQGTVGGYGDSALSAAAGNLAGIVAAIREALPLDGLAKLRQSLTGPLLGFMGVARGVTLSGLDVLDEPRAWTRDIAALSAGVIAIASFEDNLLADWNAITGVFDNLADQYDYGSSSASAPAATAWQPGATPTEAQGQALAQTCLYVNHAAAYADTAAVVLAAEAASPTLSPPEIETVVGAARQEIDAAIEYTRLTLAPDRARPLVEALKDQALALQTAGQAIIERRPPLISRTLEAPGNLRLLAHRWYGDHDRAPELARLNNPRAPNHLQMGDTIRAYAR